MEPTCAKIQPADILRRSAFTTVSHKISDHVTKLGGPDEFLDARDRFHKVLSELRRTISSAMIPHEHSGFKRVAYEVVSDTVLTVLQKTAEKVTKERFSSLQDIIE